MPDRVELPDGRVGDRGHCRSCGAEIVWVLNAKTGRRPPYDLDGESHFATCPQAATWRGRAVGPTPNVTEIRRQDPPRRTRPATRSTDGGIEFLCGEHDHYVRPLARWSRPVDVKVDERVVRTWEFASLADGPWWRCGQEPPAAPSYSSHGDPKAEPPGNVEVPF